ncbi:MAG: NYN domain-containing protein [Planctomycetes bacterium]|nr:NYN domain-containing protein [Planctomycetota bacterium]
MRACFFVDGFNLYHSLKQFTPEYRWLNLRKLCERFAKPDETVERVYYFSAFANWNPEKEEKHRRYVRALRNEGVVPVLGKFKKVTRYCSQCHRQYPAHEEKQTDVNVAMYLFECAFKNAFDRAIVISGDSDLIPPILKVQENFAPKKVGVVAPVGRKTKELKEVADFFIKMRASDLAASLFPRRYRVGDEILEAPADWLPPE